MVSVLLVFLLLLIGMALGVGLYKIEDFSIEISVKDWNSPFFQLGIQFVEHSLDDGSKEQELSIHFFFFNLILIFHKFST